MAIYKFSSQLAAQSNPAVKDGVEPQRTLSLDSSVYEGVRTEPKPRLINDQNIDHTESHLNSLEPEFLHVDRSMLNYFSNLECPSQDGLRSTKVKARVAGGDKSILAWERELQEGSRRVQLPVISISRGESSPNKSKSTPTSMPVSWTYVNNLKNARLSFAPQAWIISYTITIWANQKTDAENIIRQITDRFDHGLQDRIRIETESHVGQAIVEMKTVSFNGDVDVDSETQPKVRYDLTFSVEAWVPRKTVSVPTILGEIISIKEDNGQFLDFFGSSSSVNPFNIA